MTVMEAAAALAATLEAENDALRALDVPRALRATPHKAEQARLLRLALPALSARLPDAATRAMVARLQALADDNRALLERAMTIQSRVIATLARAAPSERVGYRPAAARNELVSAVALSARC